LSETPHELIRDGARLIRGAADLLEDLGVDPARRASAPAPDGLPTDQHAVLGALIEPMLPDAVARVTGLSIPDTIAALVRLELVGLVNGSGGRYRSALRSDDSRDAAVQRTADANVEPG
jgi:DNA processing protein